MKKLLIILVMATVVLSFPLVSCGGDAVGNGKGKGKSGGTLTIAPTTKPDSDDKTGANSQSASTATSSGTSMSSVTQTSGVNPLGYGTAIIDGVMSPGEWDNAVKIDFQANVPPSEGGGTTPATLYIMNNGLNLYFAVKVARPSFGLLTELDVDFDNNNIGTPVVGDDSFQMLVGNAQTATFIDTFRFTCPGALAGTAGCNVEDTNPPAGSILPAGTKDGDGAATDATTNNSSYTILEVWKLLCSQDVTHDFCLKPGSKVGYHATLTLSVTKASSNIMPTIGPTGAPTGGQIGGTSSAKTEIPGAGSYYGQITIVSPIVTKVIDIKIKSGSSGANSINRVSNGKIPVAILSTGDFNAPVQVDPSSLTFGRTGDEQSLAFCNEGSADVNGDGLPDLICHFKTQSAGFQSDDKFGILNGKTWDGVAFTAKDSVRIVQ